MKVKVTYIEQNDTIPVFHGKTRQKASMKATEGFYNPFLFINEYFDEQIRKVRNGRNFCVECGRYTTYSPYACEKHADRNGGDGDDD